MMAMLRRLAAAGCLALIWPAAAAGTETAAHWDYRALYAGWRAGALIGADVQGLRGNDLGAVNDLVLGSDGTVKAAAVRVTAGEAEFLVPWAEVEVGPKPDTVLVRAIDAGVPALIRDSTAAEQSTDDWRAADLLGRPVLLAGRRAFGTVDDLVFGRDGALLALLVSPDHGDGGPYAYPWALALVDRGTGAVHLPSTPEQLHALGPFDLGRLGKGVFAGR